jgi:opacity protein-like surface antigen
MKKNTLFIAASILFSLFTQAQAQEWRCESPDFHAKVFGGANFLQNTSLSGNKASYSTGYILSGSIGYYLCEGLCLEAEYAYRRNAISKIAFFTEGSSHKGHLQSSSYMANLLWDVPLFCWDFACNPIRPFIGAGIGYDCYQMHSANSRIIFNQSWRQFSWQLMAGLAYSFFPNAELTLEYKYHQSHCDFYNHAVGLGLLYKFKL